VPRLAQSTFLAPIELGEREVTPIGIISSPVYMINYVMISDTIRTGNTGQFE